MAGTLQLVSLSKTPKMMACLGWHCRDGGSNSIIPNLHFHVEIDNTDQIAKQEA